MYRPEKFLLPLLIIFCGCNPKYGKQTDEEGLGLELSTDLRPISITSIKNIKSFDVKKTDTLIFETLIRKSGSFNEARDYDSIIIYDRLLYQIAKKTNNILYRAIGESYLAYDFRVKQKFDSAFFYYQKSKNTYKQLSDSTQVGKNLLEMGKIQYRKNDYYGSKESITHAITYFNPKKDEKYLIWCWNELGNNYQELNDYKNAEENYIKAIELESKISYKALYMNNLAMLYSKKNEYTLAHRTLSDAISLIPENFNPIEYARLIHNKAECEWKLKKTNVLSTYLKALEIRKKNGDKRGLLSSYRSLAEFHEVSKPKKAKNYLDTLIVTSKDLVIPEAELEALQILFRLKPNEVKYRIRYINLSDSLDLIEKKSKNQYAYLKYQDQQEKARLLALETETAQKEVQLAQQETQKILFLSLSAILLMGGVSLYFVLKQRHKKQRLQEVYNTEKRIAQDIHDSLSNDVFSLMTKVQNKKPDTEEFLGNLEHIYNTSRQISHDNSEIQTGVAFESELKNLINTYHGRDITVVTKGMNEIDWSLLSEHKCIALHRTINEVLVNMRKHSEASLVSFTFEQDHKKLLITYTDNGVGIDPQKPKGIGLKNTVSRMNAIGSVFKLVPKNFGPGVKAEIAIPI